ncbi:hypothetical protein JCM14469_37770 [Desulfatiferula olefinivorans]
MQSVWMDGSVRDRERTSGMETIVRMVNYGQIFMKYSGVCQDAAWGAAGP